MDVILVSLLLTLNMHLQAWSEIKKEVSNSAIFDNRGQDCFIGENIKEKLAVTWGKIEIKIKTLNSEQDIESLMVKGLRNACSG